MSPSDHLAVIPLEGSGRVRGEMYGATARDVIRESAGRWRAHVLDNAPGGSDDYLSALVRGTAYRAAVERCAPDLLEEISGIAYGAGVSEDVIFAMNLLDEEWTLRERLTADGGGHHCTSLGQVPAGGGPVTLAQNLDLRDWMDGLQVLLELAPVDAPEGPQPAALVPSVAGMIGTESLNAVGLGVMLNTLPQLPTATDGLPVAFVVRLVARQPDISSAEALLQTIHHASGQNYLLGDPTGVRNVECSAAGALAVVVSGATVAHANHALRVHPKRAGHPPRSPEWLANSCERLERAAGAVSGGPLNLDDIKRLLTEPPVLRGRGGDTGHTLFGLVMECSASPVLHMSAGEPRLDNFGTYRVGSRLTSIRVMTGRESTGP